MHNPSRRLLVLACSCSLITATASVTCAQGGGAKPKAKPAAVEATTPKAGAKTRPPGDKRRLTTLIHVELITGDEGVGIRAQRWAQILEKFDVTHAIRRSTPKDKVGVSEKKSGDTVRHVQVVGKLDRNGRLVFDDRVYTEADAEKLSAWFDELREFGALGTPEGQPAWGLTKQQFGTVHELLRKPLAGDPLDRDVADALKLFAFPAELPLRMSASATRRMKEKASEGAQVTQSLAGVSRGTALAILLSEQELGFRPQRLPDATIVLSVEPLREISEPWPVGWPPEQPAHVLAPKMFSYSPIDLQEIELDAVLEAAVDFIGMPILIDRTALAAKNIDLSKVKVSHAAKRTTWGLAIKSLLAPAKVKHEMLVDEAGRPFLWITPVTAPRREPVELPEEK